MKSNSLPPLTNPSRFTPANSRLRRVERPGPGALRVKGHTRLACSSAASIAPLPFRLPLPGKTL